MEFFIGGHLHEILPWPRPLCDEYSGCDSSATAPTCRPVSISAFPRLVHANPHSNSLPHQVHRLHLHRNIALRGVSVPQLPVGTSAPGVHPRVLPCNSEGVAPAARYRTHVLPVSSSHSDLLRRVSVLCGSHPELPELIPPPAVQRSGGPGKCAHVPPATRRRGDWSACKLRQQLGCPDILVVAVAELAILAPAKGPQPPAVSQRSGVAPPADGVRHVVPLQRHHLCGNV
mmetsp:Transcript_3153/g.5021  ORF Transcript_3153/g.5021 Transcript_3153/m.5021 type:complete len:230 (-) Transcript_3153:233-922(-)